MPPGKEETIKRITATDEPPRLQSCCPWAPHSDPAEDSMGISSATWRISLSAGEMVLFDRRLGTNRAGVERVMGFCTEEQVEQFMKICPEFERNAGRFRHRSSQITGSLLVMKNRELCVSIADRRPSPPLEVEPDDLESRDRLDWKFSKAKGQMFAHHQPFPKLPGSPLTS